MRRPDNPSSGNETIDGPIRGLALCCAKVAAEHRRTEIDCSAS